jgi:hypothetical protein
VLSYPILKWLDGLTTGPITDISRAGRGTAPVRDHQILSVVKEITCKEIMIHGDSNRNLNEDFVAYYLDWLSKCTVAPVSGLEQFNVRYFVNGVTQAYDIFFYEHKGRRFRTPKGEYPYVRLSVDRWAFLEDDEVREGDAVAISAPFYAEGGVPQNFSAILDRCLELKIPVFIDAAYYGTCYGVSFDYSHPAIEMIGFSLSKPFGIESYRAGMLLTKRTFRHLEEIQTAARYFNRVGAYVGLKLMKHFDANYMPLTYQRRHRDVCYQLGVLPSNSIMLGNVREDDERFDEILADDRFEPTTLPEGQLRRVCVSDYVSEFDPPPKKIIKRALGRA